MPISSQPSTYSLPYNYHSAVHLHQQSVYLYPFLRNTPRGQITHQIFMLYGSNDADLCKGVTLLAFVNTAAHLGGPTAPKPHFWGRE